MFLRAISGRGGCGSRLSAPDFGSGEGEKIEEAEREGERGERRIMRRKLEAGERKKTEEGRKGGRKGREECAEESRKAN